MSTEKTSNQIDKKSAEYWEERVPIFIEESADGSSLPINVSVNGECITVARGVEVMVKRKFAEVINNAKKSERENRAFIRKNSKRLRERRQKAGVLYPRFLFIIKAKKEN